MRIYSFFIFALLGIPNVTANSCSPETPFYCADGTCTKLQKDCQAFEGCVDPKHPYFCSNGECAANLGSCLGKFTPCQEVNEQKCSDGKCRLNCDGFQSSACSFFTPIRCSDGSCAASLIECASFLCPADSPFRCKNNDCVETLESCQYPLNTYVVKTLQLDTEEMVYHQVLRSQGGLELAMATIPVSTKVEIRGVALSQIRDTTVPINNDHELVYQAYFGAHQDTLKSYQFIRSAVFEITNLSEQEDASQAQRPLKIRLTMKVDTIRPLRRFEGVVFANVYCLAILQERTWTCVRYQNDRKSKKKADFTINKSGVYAIIFFPDATTPTYIPGAYCGYLCQSKRLFMAFWFLIIPLMLLAGFIALNLYQLQTKVLNITTENVFLQNKMDELENVQVDFTGQTVFEKLDEGVQYYSNPLRNEEQESLEEFKALNLQLQHIKEESRKVNSTRNKLISANKVKLEEIKALRLKLGDYV